MDCKILSDIERLIKENNEKIDIMKNSLEELSKRLYQIINEFKFKDELLQFSIGNYPPYTVVGIDENGIFYYEKENKTISLKDWNSLSRYQKRELVEKFMRYMEEIKEKLKKINEDLNYYLTKLKCIEKFIKD